MTMTQPPFLSPGDTIGVMAPSSYCEEKDIAAGVAILKARGYDVFVHPQTLARHHQFAGTPEQKAAALHDLARDPSIKGVIFAGGGNGALHMLNHLDYALIAQNPKIYMGFSDCTAPLNAIAARANLITYHGPVLKRLSGNEQIDLNFSVLEGREKTIPLTGAKALREGEATGRLIGGNLSLFECVYQSGDTPDAKGAMLFLEDTGEEYSRLDRSLCHLRRIGLLDQIAALILGQFDDMKDTGRPFGLSFEDIIAAHTAGLDIPVICNAPFGHVPLSNTIMPIGAVATLQNQTLILS